ncbi:MAG: hypothetical protein MI919_37205 [Holophagales bacterium]|nr:hypothetical protein [Holophagales bacterium]
MTSRNLIGASRILVLCAVGTLVVSLPTWALPTSTQTFTLEPGWNAIYLEVTPETPEIETVFAGLPVLSVWQWEQKLGKVEFIDDPADGLLDREGWRGYFPDVPGGTPFLSNLFALFGNRAYLVRLGGQTGVQLSITGKPSLRPTEWVPDSFTLAGFHVDPSAPPTVGSYFSSSPAHDGQPVYTLHNSGVWQLMNPSQSLQSGRSYWVFTQGGSKYQGPLEILAPTRDGLELGSNIESLDLSVRNHSDVARNVALSLLPSADGSSLPALAHWQLDAEGNEVWPLLPTPFQITVDGGGERNVPLAVRRAGITAAVGGLLEVTDGAGSRYLIPVSAAPTLAGVAVSSNAAAATLKNTGGAYTGLWVGSAIVDQVSEVRRNVKRICPCPGGLPTSLCPAAADGSIQSCQDDGTGGLFCTTGTDAACSLVESGSVDPIPARREFELRLIVHCDDAGTVKLLKEVTLMFQEGSDNGTPATDDDTPGRFVLVTNDRRLSEFTGSALRDGVPVGTRVSSAAFDFPGTSVALSGSWAPDQTLSGTFTLAPDFPTNPFRHQFHPDHDQLDAQYQPFVGESRSRLFEEFEIKRSLTLELAAADPMLDPGAGDSVLEGVFKETIQGLHNQNISVAGSLRLIRVSTVGRLEE